MHPCQCLHWQNLGMPCQNKEIVCLSGEEIKKKTLLDNIKKKSYLPNLLNFKTLYISAFSCQIRWKSKYLYDI